MFHTPMAGRFFRFRHRTAANHGQLDDEDEERRPDHRANGRGDVFRLDVDGIPHREPSPVATLAREPVPDRERDGQELAGSERGARGGAKRPLENDRPFSLVVARDAGDVARVVGSDVPASLAGELHGIGAGQIEEPEIHRVLAVAEDEVGLAGARRRLRGDLDGDGVRELGCRGCRRRFLLEGVCRGLLFGRPAPLPRRRRAPAAPAGASLAPPRAGSSSSSGGTGSDGPFVPVFSAVLSCHRTSRAMESAS